MSIKCPICGKRTTIILKKGCLEYNDVLIQKQLLGFSEKTICYNPASIKYCIDCKKIFNTITYDSSMIYELFFSIGGYCDLSYEITITKKIDGFLFICTKSEYGYTDYKTIKEMMIKKNDWVIIWKKILACYVYDWNNTYVNNGIMDGTSWELQIAIILDTKKIKFKSTGLNDYPVYFKKLTTIFSKLVDEKIA